MKNIQAIHPLAPSQLGMLLESLSSPEQSLHIEQLSCLVHGSIELEHFQKAWQLVIERHGILRTAFVAKDRAEPLQVVLQQAAFTVFHEDWSGLDPSAISDKLNARLKTERELGFSLTRPPLMRVGLFKVRPERFQFVWTVHHILLDGWCLPLVLNEVMEFYSACSTGKTLRLPPAGQYGDYVAWLRRQSLPPAEAFWKEELSNFKSPTAFGDESTSTEWHSTGVAQCKFELPLEVAKSFRTLAGGLGVSIPVVLQCLWALVMARLSEKHDVVFGMTVSGRPADLPRVETIVGLFINTIPARFYLDQKADFWSWASVIQIRQHARRSFEYVSSGQIHS